MKFLSYLLLFITLMASDQVLSHKSKEDRKSGHDDEKIAIVEEDVALANTEFAVDLYKEIASKTEKSSPKNIFFSPLSVSTAFSMLSLGAKSKTYQHILEGLKLNKTHIKQEEIHDAFHHVIMALNKPKSDLQVDIGNAIFVQEQLQLQESFEQGLKKHYHAELLTSDFLHPKEAKKQINDYVKNKTEGKIEELIDDISADTMLVLLNYILFKGDWEHPFHPHYTRADTFFVDDNTTVEVQMMSRTGLYKLFQDKEFECTVLQLPYKDKASMLLIIPELGKIHEIEKVLSLETIAKWKNSTTGKFLNLNLPKFSISSSVDLIQILSGMGMGSVFSGAADFSGIANSIKLQVTKAIHKAVLDVDEKGTVAAAATAIEMTRFAVFRSFRVNRPFIVLIHSEDTDSILFMGRVTDPTAK